MSYSIYIVHFAILGIIMSFFKGGFPIPCDLGMGVLFLIALLASALVSAVTYRLIEKPGMGLGKKLIVFLDAASKPALKRDSQPNSPTL